MAAPPGAATADIKNKGTAQADHNPSLPSPNFVSTGAVAAGGASPSLYSGTSANDKGKKKTQRASLLFSSSIPQEPPTTTDFSQASESSASSLLAASMAAPSMPAAGKTRSGQRRAGADSMMKRRLNDYLAPSEREMLPRGAKRVAVHPRNKRAHEGSFVSARFVEGRFRGKEILPGVGQSADDVQFSLQTFLQMGNESAVSSSEKCQPGKTLPLSLSNVDVHHMMNSAIESWVETGGDLVNDGGISDKCDSGAGIDFMMLFKNDGKGRVDAGMTSGDANAGPEVDKPADSAGKSDSTLQNARVSALINKKKPPTVAPETAERNAAQGQGSRSGSDIRYTGPDTEINTPESALKKKRKSAANAYLTSFAHPTSTVRTIAATSDAATPTPVRKAAPAPSAQIEPRPRFDPAKIGTKANSDTPSGSESESKPQSKSKSKSVKCSVRSGSDRKSAVKNVSGRVKPNDMAAGTAKNGVQEQESSPAVSSLAGKSASAGRPHGKNMPIASATGNVERDRQMVLAVTKANVHCINRQRVLDETEINYLGMTNAFEDIRRRHAQAVQEHDSIDEATAKILQQETDTQLLYTSAHLMWSACKEVAAEAERREALDGKLRQANEKLAGSEKLLAEAEARLGSFKNTYVRYLSPAHQGILQNGLPQPMKGGAELHGSMGAGLGDGGVSDIKSNRDNLVRNVRADDNRLSHTTPVATAAPVAIATPTTMETKKTHVPGAGGNIVESSRAAQTKQICREVRDVLSNLCASRDVALQSVSSARDEQKAARMAVVDNAQRSEDSGRGGGGGGSGGGDGLNNYQFSALHAKEDLAKATVRCHKRFEQYRVAVEAATVGKARLLQARMRMMQNERVKNSIGRNIEREGHKVSQAKLEVNLARFTLDEAKRALKARHSDPNSVDLSEDALSKASDDHVQKPKSKGGSTKGRKRKHEASAPVNGADEGRNRAIGGSVSQVFKESAVGCSGSPPAAAAAAAAAALPVSAKKPRTSDSVDVVRDKTSKTIKL